MKASKRIVNNERLGLQLEAVVAEESDPVELSLRDIYRKDRFYWRQATTFPIAAKVWMQFQLDDGPNSAIETGELESYLMSDAL